MGQHFITLLLITSESSDSEAACSFLDELHGNDIADRQFALSRTHEKKCANESFYMLRELLQPFFNATQPPCDEFIAMSPEPDKKERQIKSKLLSRIRRAGDGKAIYCFCHKCSFYGAGKSDRTGLALRSRSHAT